jgi:hypothetical protein
MGQLLGVHLWNIVDEMPIVYVYLSLCFLGVNLNCICNDPSLMQCTPCYSSTLAVEVGVWVCVCGVT